MPLLQFIYAHFSGPKGDMFHVIHIPIVGQYSVLPFQPITEGSARVGSQDGKDGPIDLCFVTEIQDPFEGILGIVVIAQDERGQYADTVIMKFFHGIPGEDFHIARFAHQGKIFRREGFKSHKQGDTTAFRN